MGFSPFLQILFLISLVTATSATDAPPAPPVAGLAAAVLPAAGPPVREKRPKKRVNAALVSGPAQPKPASSAPKGEKKPKSPKPVAPMKNQLAASAPKNAERKLAVAKQVNFRLANGFLYNPFRAPSVAVLKQLITHRLAMLSQPYFPSYHPTTKTANRDGQLVNKPLRFGHPLTKRFEVDLTSARNGKKVGCIYHNHAKIVPSAYCPHAQLTGARYFKKLTVKRPADFNADAVRAAKLQMMGMPIPSSGSDVMGGPSGANHAAEERIERLTQKALRPQNESRLLENLIHGKEIMNRNVIDICRNILLPGQCANIGTPNNNNGRPAIRPTVATRYKVPFVDGKAAILVQDSLSECMRILGAGSGDFWMPTLTNQLANGSSSEWDWDGPDDSGWSAGSYKAPSYLRATQTSTFKFAQFPVYNADTETLLLPQTVTTVGSDGSSKEIEMIPFPPTGTINFSAGVGTNNTANGFVARLYFVILVDGIYQQFVEVANLTGQAILTGTITKNDWVVPADCVGLYEMSISNNLAGNVATTVAPTVSFLFSDILADVVVPAGKSDGSDFNFFAQYMPQVLIDALAAKFMFWAGFDQNVEIAFGQFDEDEDGQIPPPTFEAWGSLTRFRVKPMNDPSQNGAYVPMIRRDLDAYNFRDVNREEETYIGEQLGAYMDSTGAAGEHVIAEVMIGVTACGLIQGVDPKSGLVDVDALSEAYNLLRQQVFATGNDDHEAVMADFLLNAAKTMTAPSGDVNINFSGWLSGNDVTVV